MSAQILPSSTTPAESPSTFRRRTTSVLVRARHDRASFKTISARASSLDLGDGDASSADAIAGHFLRAQQDLLKDRVLEQQRLQRIGFRRLRNLVQLSFLHSWEASRTCGSLYKNIFDATRSIDRVKSILEAPCSRSQVGDLLVSLSDLQGLFLEQTLQSIKDVKDLFLELDHGIDEYQRGLRIQALSLMRALNRRANNGLLRTKRAMRKAKSILVRGITSRTTDMTTGSDADGENHSTDGASISDDDADDGLDVATSVAIAHHDPALPQEIEKPEFSAFRRLHFLQQAQVQLHDLKMKMYSVFRMFDTLGALVEGIHNETKRQWYIEDLGNDSPMFDAVAELIRGGHASLSKDLGNLRIEVLDCFCYINSARDLVFAM